MGFMTFDNATIDSTGEFMIHELERLDQQLHEPLYAATWGRDIDLREDVSIADELTSFTNSTFAAAGGINPNGKSWIGKDTNAISGMQLDIGKTAHSLYLWGMEISYTIPELLSAMKLGRPVDAQKFEGMNIKHQMDIDQMVYVGDTDMNQTGMLNNAGVTPSAVENGALGSPLWVNKSPDEIVADITTLVVAVWTASGYAVCPHKVLLPPVKWSYIATQKISTAGNETIMSYIENKCEMPMRVNGKKLELQPVKWCTGLGTGATDLMAAYTQEKNRIRFPLVPLQRTPLEYRSIYHLTTYFGRLGVVEIVYPETVGYAYGF
jgi:hypothetical protein